MDKFPILDMLGLLFWPFLLQFCSLFNRAKVARVEREAVVHERVGEPAGWQFNALGHFGPFLPAAKSTGLVEANCSFLIFFLATNELRPKQPKETWQHM